LNVFQIMNRADPVPRTRLLATASGLVLASHTVVELDGCQFGRPGDVVTDGGRRVEVRIPGGGSRRTTPGLGLQTELVLAGQAAY
jgi:hypothetical protein